MLTKFILLVTPQIQISGKQYSIYQWSTENLIRVPQDDNQQEKCLIPKELEFSWEECMHARRPRNNTDH